MNTNLIAWINNKKSQPISGQDNEPDSSVRITTDQDEYSIMNGEINQDKDKNMYNFMTSLWEKQQEIYDKYK